MLYLEVHLFLGVPRKHWLKLIADKVCNKFSKRKGKTLSMAGRMTLIHFVITSSLLYSFTIYKWPISLLSMIERSMRNFLWTSSINKKKLVTMP